MAYCRTSATRHVPNEPGTTAASRPVPGIVSRPSDPKTSGVAAAGAGPCPQSTNGVPSCVRPISGMSPPRPFRCGSTTCSTIPAATAATPEVFGSLGLETIPGTGLLAAVVPGSFGTWLDLLARYGTWRVADVLQYAVGQPGTGGGGPVLAEVLRDPRAHRCRGTSRRPG